MLAKYRNTHLWLLVPFGIVMLGFMPSYWLEFTEAPWRHHLHGLTATAWFLLLIVQPYVITRGHVARHRLFGMFALILAGGVVASGLAAIPFNLTSETLPSAARYGLSFGDVVLVGGFAASVAMAIRTVRQTDDHAHWMIASVFWALPPATFRLLIPVGIAMSSGPPDFDSLAPKLLGGAGVINLVFLALMMWRDKRLHPAYVLAAIGSLCMFILLPVGQMSWWISIADAVFKM